MEVTTHKINKVKQHKQDEFVNIWLAKQEKKIKELDKEISRLFSNIKTAMTKEIEEELKKKYRA